ncbi:hypothetical protein L207DRAFT_203849 [Hyaloscypha variabilis F]|uniref:Uncharacterized protein n=1 Tax=Hyaloscypha variabilis (strain UAMH 11265 / GT02V1 / F) TaxID=1149755 RepID=A0A2J6S574_HYAVF|nr:hypothetical protein L207DRAFT_203849 [Hyaloscypha variabilis F]
MRRAKSTIRWGSTRHKYECSRFRAMPAPGRSSWKCQGRGSEKGKEERGAAVCEWPKELGGWPAKRVWTLPQTLTGRRGASSLGSARMRLWMACLQVIASRGWARLWRSWMRLQAPQPYSNPLDVLFFPSPHLLVHSLTHLPQPAIDLLYLQPFLSPAPNTLFVHLFSLGH